VQCSANGNDIAAAQGECLERQGHDSLRDAEKSQRSLESALLHTLAGGTTALLNPKSEFMKPLRPGSMSFTLMKNAKASYGPTSRSCGSLPGPAAPSAWKILAKMSQDPARKQGTRRSFLCQFGNPVGHLALPAHACGPQCASLTGCLRESLPATCLSLPKSPLGAYPEDFASFALFQHCRSRRDSPTQQVCDHPFQDR
jgi:hypothetical protein